MSGSITAADANACSSRSYEVQQLAGRVAAHADSLDALIARFGRVQLADWESPAGRAYRTAAALQLAALGRVRERLRFACEVVLQHAQGVAASSVRTPGGGY